MQSLNIKLAQRASKDPGLLAFLIDQYSEVKNLRWEDVGNQLWIDDYRLARLALCRRPRAAEFADDIAQVAHYVGLDQDRLAGFIRSAEGARTEPSRKQKVVVRQTARTHNRRFVWAFAVALLLLVFLSAFVFFQPKAAAATLLVLEGDVTVLKAENSTSLIPGGKETSIAVGKVATVEAGDTIRVGHNGYVQLQLADGSTIDLFEDTELKAETLNISPESYQVRLKLLTGRAVNRVKRLLNQGDVFELITPSSTVSVRGTVFTVQVISPEITYVSCDEGVVQVRMGDLVVEVRAGEEVTAALGEPLNVQPQPDWQAPAPVVQPTDLPFPTPASISTPAIPSATPVPEPDELTLPPSDEDPTDDDPGEVDPGDDDQGDDDPGDDDQGDDDQGDDKDKDKDNNNNRDKDKHLE